MDLKLVSSAVLRPLATHGAERVSCRSARVAGSSQNNVVIVPKAPDQRTNSPKRSKEKRISESTNGIIDVGVARNSNGTRELRNAGLLAGTRLMQEYNHLFKSQKTRRWRVPSWCIPFGYAFTAIVLGFALPRIEMRFLPHLGTGMSIGAAVALYSSVAAGMITWTGIVFSLVFVMVQFSATAYSPRLVLWMSRSPLVSHAIGVFTATFLYAIAALAWVDRQSSGRVPFLSAVLVLALLMASVGVFVGLVQSLNRLQIHNVLAFTGGFGRKTIDLMYPPLQNSIAAPGLAEFRREPVKQILVYHGSPRSIQSLDVEALSALAEHAGAIIEMTSAVGDTLVEGTSILRVYGAKEPIRERDLRSAIRTGAQRTFEQDPKYSIQLLSDIAVRALSTAVNDPITAVQALDQIEDLLRRLGWRLLEIGEVRDKDGCLRLVIPVPAWEDFLELAFSQIRSYGATSMQVMRRMKALVSDLIDTLPEERCLALRHEQKRLDRTIARSFPDIEDQLEASAEDREGFGAARRHHANDRFEASAGTLRAALEK